MSDFEIIKLVLGGLAFLLTWTGMVVGATRIIEKIKQDVSEKLAAESIQRSSDMDSLQKDFFENQKMQDDRVGETVSALRRFIEGVEKEMHEIELWGRDNYVQKNEFERAISSLEKASDSIRSDIKELIAEIKAEFKELRAEMTKH